MEQYRPKVTGFIRFSPGSKLVVNRNLFILPNDHAIDRV